MPTSDHDQDRDDQLEDSINELETFIDQTEKLNEPGVVPVLTESVEEQSPTESKHIPILDELAGDEPLEVPDLEMEKTAVSEEQLMGLIDKLDDRFTEVLQTLFESIKKDINKIISEEVELQLRKVKNNPESGNQSGQISEDIPDIRQPGDYPTYDE